MDYERIPIQVRKFGHVIPVTAEQLLDAGLPLPPGMEPPAPYTPTPLTWRTRWRRACADRIAAARRGIGFWIASYEPHDEDW